MESGLDRSLLELRCWPLQVDTADITQFKPLVFVGPPPSIRDSNWNSPAGVFSEDISLIADKLGDDLSGLSLLKLEVRDSVFGLLYLMRLMILLSFTFSFEGWLCWLAPSLHVALWASKINSSCSLWAWRCWISVWRFCRFSSNPSVSC